MYHLYVWQISSLLDVKPQPVKETRSRDGESATDFDPLKFILENKNERVWKKNMHMYNIIFNVIFTLFKWWRQVTKTNELERFMLIVRVHVVRGKMVPGKMVPGKNGPREKWYPEKWSPENWSPENWSQENWSPEKWSPENWSPENSETKNRGVSVEQRGVCVEFSDVIHLWKIKTRQQTQNSEMKNRGVNVEHRGVYVCGMFGCDQSMKTQNSTTNLPGLL